MSSPVVGISGVGTVGETLARSFDAADYRIGGIYNRTHHKAKLLATDLNTIAIDSVKDFASHCDLILLTVSDDAIETIAYQLSKIDLNHKAVVHVSGAASLDVLRTVQNAGAMVGSLHPAYPFSSVEVSIKGLHGATFAIESSHDVLRGWLIAMVKVLHGKVIEIPIGKKAQYHAALAIASNYMVTLYAVAQGLLMDISDDSEAVDGALDTLMSGTMQNLIEQGIPQALTGPLVRGDSGTLAHHLDALKDNVLLYDTYINLAKLSYPMLSARGTDIDKINPLFRQENTNASDDT